MFCVGQGHRWARVGRSHCWEWALGACTEGQSQSGPADPPSPRPPPWLQAAAVVYVARKQAGVLPYWPTVLQELTGYDERVHQQVGGVFLGYVLCVEFLEG